MKTETIKTEADLWSGVIDEKLHCSKCGAPIGEYDHYNVSTGEAVCYDCFDPSEIREGDEWSELRECEVCHRLMCEGYTNLENVYVCQDCWDGYVEREGFRENDHSEKDLWDGGYWDAQDANGKWYDTGVFWTDWYE